MQRDCTRIDFSRSAVDQPCVIYYDVEMTHFRDVNVDQFELASHCRQLESCGKQIIKPRLSSNLWYLAVRPETAGVVGGNPAVPHSWPWAVHLFVYKGRHERRQCAGSIISSRWILTAAHCVEGVVNSPRRVQLFIGSHSLQSLRRSDASVIDHIVVHPYSNFGSDLALLRTRYNITFGAHVQPICLPRSRVPIQTRCVVVGWGETQDTGPTGYLNQLQLLSANPSRCESIHFCTMVRYGRNACKGDSGGPLMCPVNGVWTLYGITHAVDTLVWAQNDCVMAGRPAMYMRVEVYMSWFGRYITDLTTTNLSSTADRKFSVLISFSFLAFVGIL